jgi:membrane-associated phospholipid phosphatase
MAFGTDVFSGMFIFPSRLITPYTAVTALVTLFVFCLPDRVQAIHGPADSTRVRPDLLQTVWADAGIVWQDGVAWVLAPLSFSGNDWLVLGGIGAATAGVYAADGELRSVMRRNQSSGWYDAAGIANEGSRAFWAQTLTGALYLPGLLFDVEELRVTGRMLGQTLIYAGALTMAIRIVLGRNRPYSELGPASFEWMEFANARQAMPSGHTTVAFSIASVLSRRIEHPAATVLLYLAATATGVSRMYHDQHWASDVLLAAVIGHTAGMFVATREEERRLGVPGVTYGWSVHPSSGGITLLYRF